MWDDISKHGVRLPRCSHHDKTRLTMSFDISWTTVSSTPDFPPASLSLQNQTKKLRSECEREIKTLTLIMSLNALISGKRLNICLEAVTDFLGCLQGGNGTSLRWLNVWLHLFSACFHWHAHAPFYWNSRCHFFHPLFGKCSSFGQCRAVCLFFRLLVVEI